MAKASEAIESLTGQLTAREADVAKVEEEYAAWERSLAEMESVISTLKDECSALEINAPSVERRMAFLQHSLDTINELISQLTTSGSADSDRVKELKNTAARIEEFQKKYQSA